MGNKSFAEKKQEAYEFGKYAEEVIAAEYIRKGYTVVERNKLFGKTEIDIIARKQDTIVIIEVKARSGDDEDAVSSVTQDKRRRMVKAADSYIRSQKGQLYYRFDIAAVTGNFESHTIEIFEDAFVGADLF